MRSTLSIFSAPTFTLPPSPAGMPAIGTICHAFWGMGTTNTDYATVCFYRERTAFLIDPHGQDYRTDRFHDGNDLSPIGWQSRGESATAEEVAALISRNQTWKAEKEATRIAKKDEESAAVARGMAIAALLLSDCKSLIIASRQEDRSDSQTDYYASRTVETVVLATSKHTRDIFSEMRKAAGRIPETAHLVEGGQEYREKYSGGEGYYLKAGGRHWSGWKISKITPYQGNWPEHILASLGTRHGLAT